MPNPTSPPSEESEDASNLTSEDSDLKVLQDINQNLESQLEMLSRLDFKEDVTPASIPESKPPVSTKKDDPSKKSSSAEGVGWFLATSVFVFALLIAYRPGVNVGNDSNGTTSSLSSPETTNSPDSAPVSEKSVSTNEPSSNWESCQNNAYKDSATPQSGEVWWPVVGPPESLDAIRSNCRSDAFINKSGNTQIASFRDRGVAVEFAQTLTNGNSPTYRFWVGDPSPH